ncbi:MAG: MmgE/PrpD family protein [Nitrospinota bacterium]|nr:MAG: MmgE/PrpD family protein [Nitrospinota bacterium]
MHTTRQLASLVHETRYTDLPGEAIQKAKYAILDTLGVTLAGATSPAGEIIARYTKSLGGAPQASVLGHGFRTSPPQAALANGTMAHAYDYDDVNWSMSGHPSVPLLPAVLAVAEAQGASGKDLLTAYVIGFEVEAKIGRGVNPAHYQLGWHATSTLGVFGATAAVARLLQLSPQKIARAFGIAASLSSGIRQNFGTMTKPLHPGHAAMGGVMAATLAQMDFTADEGILEAPFGFARLYTGGGEFQLEQITQTFGAPYDLVDPGVVIKQYPCCAFTHRAIDATLDLVQKHQFAPEAVAEVECLLSRLASDVLIHARPHTALEGKFSLEYCLAAAILDRKVGLAQFTDEMVQRPQAQELLQRVKRQIHPVEATAGERDDEDLPVTVTIKLRDGRKYSQQVDLPKGHPQNPLSESELQAKFRECASLVLSSKKIDRVLEQLEQLETLPTLTPLLELLR